MVWVYDQAAPQRATGPYPGVPVIAWLLRKGRVTLTFDSGKESYGPGMWLFPPAQKGRQEFSPDARLLSVRFIAEWPTGESFFDRSRTRTLPAARTPNLTRIGERLARLVGREFPGITYQLPHASSTFDSHIEMHRLFFGWMRAYADAMKQLGLAPSTINSLDPRVREAVHLLDKRPLSHALREKDLAQAVGLSVSHLHKLFLERLGRTPSEYWERKRVHAAHFALLESDQSIKSIAYSLGFKSLSHFSLWVTKRLGHSPRKLRDGPNATKSG